MRFRDGFVISALPPAPGSRDLPMTNVVSAACPWIGLSW